MEHRTATLLLGLLVLGLLGIGGYLQWRRSHPPPRHHAHGADRSLPPATPPHGRSAPSPRRARRAHPAAPRRRASDADRMEALRLRTGAREDKEADRAPACLQKLDRADRLAPDPTGQWAFLRATCEIRAGKCDQGEARILTILGRARPNRSRERLRQEARSIADRWCPLDVGPPVDRVRRLARLIPRLRRLGHLKRCRALTKALSDLWATVAPSAPAPLRTSVHNAFVEAARCAGWLGHCDEAWRLWVGAFHRKHDASLPAAHVDRMARRAFSSGVRGCDPPPPRAAAHPAARPSRSPAQPRPRPRG